MIRDLRSQFWPSAVQCLGGSAGLILLTVACFQLRFGLEPTGFAFLILIVLLALMGSLIGSVVLSILAVGLLNYFFAPPLFSLRVDYPQDVFVLSAFLTTSLIVTSLAGMVRKAAAEARASNKALVDTIPALVWSALPDGSRDFQSERWLGFTGLSEQEARGDGWLKALHPQDRAVVVKKWRSAVATGTSFEAEGRARHVTGEYRWFLARAEPLRNERGAIVRWYGSNTDIEDRKRATEALRESEEQWREVFEHNPVMYFMVEASGKVLSVNGFGATQLGYSVTELVGQSILEVFFKEDQEFVRRNLADCTEDLGQSRSWEVRKIRKDGTFLWVRENAKAVRREENQRIILVACEDITQRKLAESALRQSEMYLAEAQRISRTGSFGWSVASGEIIWSEETYRIFEFDRSIKPSVKLVLQRTHPEDRPRIQQLLDRVSHDKEDWDFEHRLLMPTGSVKCVRVVAHAVRDARGNLELIGAVMDITDRKRAEYLTEQVFEMSPDGVSIVGRDYCYLRVNPIYERNFEIAAQSIVGMSVADLFGKDVFEQTIKPKLDRCFGGEEVSYAWWVTNEHFRRYHAVTYSPLRPDSERVEAALVITRDLTEHMLASEALQQAQANLERVTRVTTLGELTAAIAHEVNQPLAGLVTSGHACLRWLTGETPNLEAARRAVERMINDGRRASEVIGRIRALVRKSAPRGDWMNINDAITEVIALIRSELQRNRILLRTELSNDLPLVLGDRIQLQQVILNLTVNAIEAMSGLGPDQPRELLVVSLDNRSKGVFVTVRDTGTGLDSKAPERLFDAFYTTKPDGMGMGLAISRTIVEAHGGQLEAMPNVPRGAIFQFHLPIDSEKLL